MLVQFQNTQTKDCMKSAGLAAEKRTVGKITVLSKRQSTEVACTRELWPCYVTL